MSSVPRNFTNDDAPVPVMGVIKSVQGTSPGPASGITYTVSINKPGGGVVDLAGVKPSNARPTAADINAADVGTIVSGWIVGGNAYFTIIEQYAGGGCA